MNNQNNSLGSSLQLEPEMVKSEYFHLNFTLSFIQSFLLISLSQLSDQTIISFIQMQSITNTQTAFLSCSISSIILMLLFLIIGYGISMCIPYHLICSFAIFIFLFASVYLLIKSHQSVNQTFDDDLHIKKQKERPKPDFNRQLSVIPENKEDSKCTAEDIIVPLMEKQNNGCSLDQREEIDDLINFHLVIESIGKKISIEWLNKSYFFAFIIAMLFDFSAVVPGAICSIMLELAIADFFWNEMICSVSVKQVDQLLAGVVAIYGIQIYLMK